MGRSKFPRLSEKEFLIMQLLATNNSRQMYGLELVEKSNGALLRGTIYVTLSRLEEKGYVKSEREEAKPGVATPRRLYKVTGEGARVFRALNNVGGREWFDEMVPT